MSLAASSAARLQGAIGATRQMLSELPVAAGEAVSLEELLAWAQHELAKPLPNLATLAVPLNSVARSLSALSAGRNAALRLDAAMREAGITTTWER